jgi:hypothetical protein
MMALEAETIVVIFNLNKTSCVDGTLIYVHTYAICRNRNNG